MPIWANILRSGRAQKNVRPGTGGDRHSQTPQARAAAVSLVEDDQVEQPQAEQEVAEHGECVIKIVRERLRADLYSRGSATEQEWPGLGVGCLDDPEDA